MEKKRKKIKIDQQQTAKQKQRRHLSILPIFWSKTAITQRIMKKINSIQNLYESQEKTTESPTEIIILILP